MGVSQALSFAGLFRVIVARPSLMSERTAPSLLIVLASTSMTTPSSCRRRPRASCRRLGRSGAHRSGRLAKSRHKLWVEFLPKLVVERHLAAETRQRKGLDWRLGHTHCNKLDRKSTRLNSSHL